MTTNNVKTKHGIIVAVSVSKEKGTKKSNTDCIELKSDFGIIGDAHAGAGIRQVSLLAEESIDKIRAKGLNVSSGDFAENITTSGIELVNMEIGSRLKVGESVILEITQIGKECHSRCNIYYQAGDCVMPREGVFARVIQGGSIKPGDNIAPLLKD